MISSPRPGAFAALRYPNYRLWFAGQATSLIGTWMQSVAQGWVVYELTGSKFALGAISFAGSLPTLFLMLPAGALVDRWSRRRLLVATQSVMMLYAFILAGLAASGVLQVWHIGLLAFTLGIANSFDAPARQAMAAEMVDDRRDLMNAVALNSAMFNLARILGPALGCIVLAAVGAAWCFTLNGLSFLAVIWALTKMRLPAAARPAKSDRLASDVGDGLRYVRHNPSVRALIMLAGASSLFGLTYATLMPAFAADILQVGEAGLGALNAAVGAGALIGSMTVAFMGRFRRKGRLLTAGSLIFPTALILFSSSRSFLLSLACLVFVGFGWVAQNATSNTLVQSIVPDELRGRVMAVYTFMFFGITPFGALLAGTLAQVLGPARAVAINATITLTIGIGFIIFSPIVRRLEA